MRTLITRMHIPFCLLLIVAMFVLPLAPVLAEEVTTQPPSTTSTGTAPAGTGAVEQTTEPPPVLETKTPSVSKTDAEVTDSPAAFTDAPSTEAKVTPPADAPKDPAGNTPALTET